MPDKNTDNEPKPAKATGAPEASQSAEQVKLRRTLETLKKELDETYRGFSAISSELFDTASALETSEKRLKMAADGAGIGLWNWEIERDSLTLNEGWFRLLGIDQVPEKPHWSYWQDRAHPDDVDKVSRALRQHIAGETKEFQVEHRLKTADGEWNWFLALGRASSHGNNGNSKRLAGILLDINPRKAAEEKARLSARRFESISKSAIDGILSLDKEGRIIGWNAAISELLDYSEEEVVGRFAGLIVPEDLQDLTTPGIHRIFRGDLEKFMERVTEGQLLSKHGRVIPIEFSLATWETEDGTCYTAIIRDITERKEAEERVRRSEKRLSSIFKSAVDGIVMITEKGIIWEFSPSATAMFQRKADEVIGQNVKILMCDDDAGQHDGFLDRFGKEGGESSVVGSTREVVAKRKDGTEFPIQISISKSVSDERANYTGIIRDMTEKSQQEAALRRARDVAEDATRAKDRFLAAMSHEIRTPMNGVVGMIELLQDTTLADDQRRMLKTAKDSSFALLTIINDILDFSKIEADMMEIEIVAFDLRKVADAVGEILGVMAAEKGLPLVVHVQPEVPRLLMGDEVRIRQILLNLAGNALKFTEDGEIHIAIRLAATDDDGSAEVIYEIKDSGIGMTEEQVSRLFKPFEQAEASTARRYGGTGLGLSIVARLTEMMGGKTDVESEPGKGSTFRVTLQHSVPKAKAGEAAAIDLGRMKILALASGSRRMDLLAQIIECEDRGHLESLDPTSKPEEVVAALIEAEAAGDPYDLVYLATGLGQCGQEELRRTIMADEYLKSQPRFVIERHNAPIAPDGPVTVMVPVTPVIESNLRRALAIVLGKAIPSIIEPAALNTKAHEVLSIEEAEAAGTLVLVAEDNKINQVLIGLQLTKLGYTHEIADDGKIALRMLSERAYGLLLSDVYMPNMDGYELTKAIRDKEEDSGARLPVVSVSSNALQAEGERCLEAGMDALLPKPTGLKELRECLETWLPESGASS